MRPRYLGNFHGRKLVGVFGGDEIQLSRTPVGPDPATSTGCTYDFTRHRVSGRDDLVDHDEVDGHERDAVLDLVASELNCVDLHRTTFDLASPSCALDRDSDVVRLPDLDAVRAI